MPDPTRLGSKIVDGREPASESAPSDQLPRLEKLGDFELIREIGRGGMGVVYEAQQISLKRRVALKVLPPALTLGSTSIQRFEREAHAAAKLHHTNIVPVYAIGREEGHHFYAMELVDGQSLDGVLSDVSGMASNPLLGSMLRRAEGLGEPDESAAAGQESVWTSGSDSPAGSRRWFDAVAALTAEVADALNHAHERGVIHRDIKPGNLLLSRDGKVWVTDFGLARLTEESGLTLSGSFLGTPAYMSPEQIAAGRMKLDHRTDVYSLGVVLYELLTLRRAFDGTSREEVIAAIMTGDPRSPRRLNPRVPLDLETICLKTMEKDPDRRYPSAAELARDLRRFLNRGLISARRAGPLRRAAKAVRRHPLVATVVVSLMLLVGVAGGFIRHASRLEMRERLQRAVSTAQMHLNAGLYREGLEQAEGALVLDRESPTARLVRARLLMKLGRTREAVQEVEMLLQKDPEDWTAHLILASAARELPWISVEEHTRVVEEHAPESADAYYLRSLAAEASADKLALLQHALELNPGHTGVLVEKITLLTNDLKDHPAALRDCELLIALRPGSAQGRRMRALVYADQQDYEQALTEIERAIELDPMDAVNFGARARVFSDMARHDEAIADLDRAIELDSGHAPFYEDRAAAFNAAGMFGPATEDARRALDLNPDRRSAYLQLFHALLRLEREDELREVLDRLRSATDTWADRQARAWAYREIADQLRRMKDYEQALADAGRAIDIDPDEFRGYIYRARINKQIEDRAGLQADCDDAAEVEVREPRDLGFRGGELRRICERLEAALADHDRLVERFPNWYDAYGQRAQTYIYMFRYEEALADLTRAIGLAPNSSRSHSSRGYVLWELNRPEESMAALDKAIGLDRHDAPRHYSNRGYMNFQLGRVEQALADFDRAIDLDPRYADTYPHRGKLLAFLGRCEDALEDLRKASSLTTTDPWMQEAQASAQLDGLRHGCREHYDPAAALRYAEQALSTQGVPTDETYGHALYRNGRHAEAKAAILRAFERKKGNGAWFVLAMCSWQLGDTAEAGTYYRRSVAWMDEHNPEDPVLLWRREEAAQLLGIQP